MKRETIRTGVALVHTIPGAAAMLTMSGGDRFLVAHHRPDALLTPCQLRPALIEPPIPDAGELMDSITAMHFFGGVTHLGGGLFARCRPDHADERWFSTVCPEEHVSRLAGECPEGIGQHVSMVVKVDEPLGTCAVSMSAPPGNELHLDEAAYWLMSRVMVAELITATAESADRRWTLPSPQCVPLNLVC